MDRADVIILGGGLVGLALAAALDSSGLSSIIIDPANPAGRLTQAFDGRTSAVSSTSMPNRSCRACVSGTVAAAEQAPSRRLMV